MVHLVSGEMCKRPESTGGGSRAAQRRAKKRAREGAPADELPCQRHSAASAETAPAAAAAAASSEWTIPMPSADSDLGEAIELARAQAGTVTGRKYRYGAVLLAEDIVLRASSNRTPFQRSEIHAEMAALKGCARPAGKDVVLVRLAPVKPPSSGADADADDDDELDKQPPTAAAAAAALVPGRTVPGKMLNAKPCATCEAKMTQRGICRVYYTVNARECGVMQLNQAT